MKMGDSENLGRIENPNDHLQNQPNILHEP